ncbi:hypothetical protein [Rhodopirellula islandica]|nr:hypothetical protein [Rhodopirellula islandica]
MLEAQSHGMNDAAKEHAHNLQQWLEKGGFAPSFSIAVGDRSGVMIAGMLAKDFCRAACRSILSDAKADPSPHLG